MSRDRRQATIKVLGKAADYVGKLAQGNSVLAMGALAVAALLRTTAELLQNSDLEMDELLRRMKTPRNLEMPWDSKPGVAEADTKREKRPSKAPSK